MIPEKSLVIYKGRPATVSSREGDKINIAIFGGDALKVREKDVEAIHQGPCAPKDLAVPAPSANVREAWELLSEDAASPGVPLSELADLVYGEFTPRAAWATYELLRKGLYFSGDIKAVKARPGAAVEEEEKRREEKQRETGDRAAFLERLGKLPPFNAATSGREAETAKLSEGDRRCLQDAEALALGKTGKSRTLKDLGKSETPEEAHKLLLASGAWTVWVNPHPSRFGLDCDSAKIAPPPPPEEERLDLTNLAAYAIDNSWSGDPDDAVSLEGPDAEGRCCLWVHVADPAASILPGSPVDTDARGRGATLYLPEGASRMIALEALPLFALGLSETSPALSFKMRLNPDLAAEETEIFPSLVRVTRLTYAEADALIAEAGNPGEGRNAGAAGTLASLAALAARNVERRLDTGAVMIQLPGAHIAVSLGNNAGENRITVEPETAYRSAEAVRECMILAGEGAARWALRKHIPFPFISQEAGELPERRLPGYAGAWQLRRCMRPRSLSAKPGVHWGLGLDEYTQVTSPLRRYTDLLCHQQIRAALGAGLYRGLEPLGEEEVLFRVSSAEAATSLVNRAERASRAHWLAVFLSDKRDSVWEAVVLDRKGGKGTVIIPSLGLETQAILRGSEEPNDTVCLSLSSVKIPEGEANFVPFTRQFL